LQPLPAPSRPWSEITMDFVVKLPTSKSCDSIWVVIDRFTKMAHFVPCKETLTARQLARLFFDHIVKIHGVPDSIVSHRGTLFVSKFWKALLSLMKIKRNLSSAYHPESDGQTERTNRTLEQFLRCYINYQQDDWVHSRKLHTKAILMTLSVLLHFKLVTDMLQRSTGPTSRLRRFHPWTLPQNSI
jgi:transposase InsO family protein